MRISTRNIVTPTIYLENDLKSVLWGNLNYEIYHGIRIIAGNKSEI